MREVLRDVAVKLAGLLFHCPSVVDKASFREKLVEMDAFDSGGFPATLLSPGSLDNTSVRGRAHVASLPPVSQEQVAVGLEDVVQFQPWRWLQQAAIEDPFGFSAREKG